MPTVDDYLDLVDLPRPLHWDDPREEALLALLVLIAFSDGELAPKELDFLRALLPDDDEALRAFACNVEKNKPAWLVRLGVELETLEDRWKGLRFAARMAWKDGLISPAERQTLEAVARALSLPDEAVDNVLRGLASQPDRARIPAAQIASTLDALKWEMTRLGPGTPKARDLAEALPPGAQPVERLALDGVEVLCLCEDGLLGRFMEGIACLPWPQIVAFTRVPVFAASLAIHDERGNTWTLVDSRLRGLGLFLERLHTREAP